MTEMKQGSVVQGEKLAWSSDQISAAVIYGNIMLSDVATTLIFLHVPVIRLKAQSFFSVAVVV